MSDPEIDRLRTELAEWRTKALDVEKHPVVAALRAELEAAKKERDEARGVEEYWKQHGEPIAAALRELAASRQSEERLRDVVFDVHHNFLSGLVGSWAAPNPPLCFCMEGGICPAIPIREDAKRFMEKTEAALAAPAPDKVLPPHIEVELRQPERYYQDTGKRMRKLPYMALVGSPGDGPHRLRMREALGAVFQPGDRIWIIKAPAPDPQPQDKGGDALAEMIAAEDKMKKRRERRREREQNDLDYVEGGDATESAAAEQNKRGGPVQVAAGAGGEVKAPVPAQDLAGGTGPGALLVDSPAQRESPAVTSSVAPAAASTGRSDAHREPRSARFTVLADSEEATQDYILLDVPPAQALALFDKLQDVLAVAAEYGRREVLIGVHLEVEAHRQVYVDRDGTRSYPPSLLRDDIDSAPAPEKS